MRRMLSLQMVEQLKHSVGLALSSGPLRCGPCTHSCDAPLSPHPPPFQENLKQYAMQPMDDSNVLRSVDAQSLLSDDEDKPRSKKKKLDDLRKELE